MSKRKSSRKKIIEKNRQDGLHEKEHKIHSVSSGFHEVLFLCGAVCGALLAIRLPFLLAVIVQLLIFVLLVLYAIFIYKNCSIQNEMVESESEE